MIQPEPLSYAAFEAYAELHDGRFEFVDGQAVAMGTPSDAHQDLAFVLGKRIDEHLVGSPCRVRLAGRLRTGENERCPDLFVVCDGKPRRLVCEILSPNRGDDLTSKLTEYRAMHEFSEYLVLDSTRPWVRVYRRSPDGRFDYDCDRIGGFALLASIGYTLDIDALYREASTP